MAEVLKDADWDEVVSRLIQLTREGLLQWRPAKLSRRPLGGEFVGSPLVAEYAGKRIAVFEHAVPEVTDDGDRFLDSQISVEFVDHDNETEWVWPSGKRRSELLDTARFNASDVSDFLKRVLTPQ